MELKFIVDPVVSLLFLLMWSSVSQILFDHLILFYTVQANLWNDLISSGQAGGMPAFKTFIQTYSSPQYSSYNSSVTSLVIPSSF